MSDLVRFGVAMDRALLSDFDRRIAALGYENRSEALRDLVRADLTKAAWDGGAVVAATLTVVYRPAVRDVVTRLSELEEQYSGFTLCSLHVRLDRHRSLDVLVLRGRAADLSALAGRLGGMKGVLSCELTLASHLGPEAGTAPPPSDNSAGPAR
jgi:CopG family nickel-responsive transcriptional regulator